MSGVGLTGKIVPLNGGAFPVFEDINGQGGLRAEADVAARNAIPANSRKIGMVVVTQDDGVQHQLVGGITNADWQVVKGQIGLSANRIDSGNTGGLRLVDIETATLESGTLATVVSVGAIFSLVLAAPAALLALVDGITIVQSVADSTSVWVRRAGNDPSFAATPPLFIDPSLGSDDNDGLLVGTALRSADEWCRRMNGQIIKASFTVTCAAGDIGNFGPCQLGENSTSAPALVTVQGASTLSAQVGTVTSVTAQNSATGQEFIFLDSSGVGPVIADGARLRIVSSAVSANVGGIGYVKGFGAGGATNPYTTTWTTAATGTGFFPQAGDTYVVETLTTIVRSVDTKWFNPFSPGPTVGGFAWTGLLLQTERFAAYQIVSNELVGNSNFSSYFINCIFNDALSTSFVRCNFRTYGCEFKVVVNVTYGPMSFHSACFRAGLQVANGGVVDLTAASCCFDGASLINISSGGSVVSSTDVCFSRGSGASGAILVQAGGRLLPSTVLWTPPVGARNALVYGLLIYSGGVVTVNFFSEISGLLGSTYNVASEGTSQVQQLTVVENNLSGVMDRTLGNGGLMLLKDIVTGAGGSIPTASPTLGSERFSSSGGQFARSQRGALSTVVPLGGPAVANHAALSPLRGTSPTVQTVGATTGTVYQYSVAVPLISGSLDNLGLYVEATFVGYDATGGAVVSTKVSRTFKRVAGTLTALGAQAVISPVAGDAALLAATVALNATGSVIQMQATGVAGVTLNWVVHFEACSTEFVG